MAKQGQADPFPPGDDDGRLALVRRPPCQKAGQRWLDVPGLGPHAEAVSVVGDFNDWEEGAAPLARKGEIWEGFLARPAGLYFL